MKKLVILVVSLILVSSAALATTAAFDFSGLSLAQLVEVQQQLNLAMWATDEWQEVEVPAGVYEIGKDIPAGHWTLSPKSGRYVIVRWGTALDSSKTDLDGYESRLAQEGLDGDDVANVSWELTDGTYLVVESGSVIFTPFSGHKLGFK